MDNSGVPNKSPPNVDRLILEVPTGGLADTLGRRPVLLLAGVLALASTLVGPAGPTGPA